MASQVDIEKRRTDLADKLFSGKYTIEALKQYYAEKYKIDKSRFYEDIREAKEKFYELCKEERKETLETKKDEIKYIVSAIINGSFKKGQMRSALDAVKYYALLHGISGIETGTVDFPDFILKIKGKEDNGTEDS